MICFVICTSSCILANTIKFEHAHLITAVVFRETLKLEAGSSNFVGHRRERVEHAVNDILEQILCQPSFTQFALGLERVVTVRVELATMTSSTTASQEELKKHKVPLSWRDSCSA